MTSNSLKLPVMEEDDGQRLELEFESASLEKQFEEEVYDFIPQFQELCDATFHPDAPKMLLLFDKRYGLKLFFEDNIVDEAPLPVLLQLLEAVTEMVKEKKAKITLKN